MGKKFVVLVICMFFCATVSAQIGFGVKSGAVFANQKMGKHWDAKSKWGMITGVIATYPLNEKLDLQGELYYANRGFTQSIYTSFDQTKSSNWAFTYHYMNIPLLVKFFPMGKCIYLAAGPQFGYLMDHSNDIEDWPKDEPREELDWKDEYRRLDFSLVGGIGAIFNNGIFVDVRYDYGLTKVLKNGEANNRGLELSIGYMF